MANLFKPFTVKRLIILILLLLMYIIVVFSVIELALVIWQSLTIPPLLLQTGELVDLLGLFLLILVAIELLDTVQVYLSDDVVHAEVVIEAAIIAVARKTIILDLKATPPLAVIGLGAILIALAGGYYVLRLSHGRIGISPTGSGQNQTG